MYQFPRWIFDNGMHLVLLISRCVCGLKKDVEAKLLKILTSNNN